MTLTVTPQAWYAEADTFDFEGHAIPYRVAGDGDDAVMLIHGFPTCSWDWAPLWTQLCERYGTVVAPDMLGFGRAPKPRGQRYDLMEQADLHVALARHHGFKRVRVLAHDYGVSVAQELLARQIDGTLPFTLAGVALLNGGLFPETHRQTRMQKLLRSPLGGLIVQLATQRSFNRGFSLVFGPNTQPTSEELDAFWSLVTVNDGHRQLHRLIRYIDDRIAHRDRWVGALQQAQCPLRLINGPEDPVSGAHMVARYRELVPQPDTVSLPGIGHYPQVEDPDGVWTALTPFFDRLAERR
ncbi:alpha/beta fold hydrolase [Polycyclovorans algicola]|uniref:alpha/beta fold hydrolase n=1 Tax=Polycyclovorans algicola TaxID=616992 RepID=UPI000693AAEE|nr:alpha/beta hydrolase [Polycyclovorans algicola]